MLVNGCRPYQCPRFLCLVANPGDASQDSKHSAVNTLRPPVKYLAAATPLFMMRFVMFHFDSCVVHLQQVSWHTKSVLRAAKNMVCLCVELIHYHNELSQELIKYSVDCRRYFVLRLQSNAHARLTDVQH